MKMFLLVFTVLAITQVAFAQEVGEEDASAAEVVPAAPSQAYLDAVEKIGRVREALKVSALNSTTCPTPDSPGCSWSAVCDKFSGKKDDFYLYQNADGRKIPNYNMVTNLTFAEACLRRPFPQASVQDPFSYPEQLVSAQRAGGEDKLRQNQAIYKLRLENARKLFSDVQARVVAMLEKRKDGSNTKEINNLIQRLKSVKFESPKLGDGTYILSAEGCESPNAFYAPAKHSVTICPQFLNLPDAALIETMAHEIGHSIDPCMSAFSFNADTKGEISRNIPESMGGFKNPGKMKFSAVAPEKNPMKSVVACLQRPSSIGTHVPTQAELLKKIDVEVNKLRSEARQDTPSSDEVQDGEILGDATLAKFDDDRDSIKKNYNSFKYCGSLTGNGHMQESFSDWVASQIIAGKISEIPDTTKARQFAFESQAVFMSVGCENVQQASVGSIQSAVGNECPAFTDAVHAASAAGEETESDHPETADRANKIMFAKPEIRKGLGCQTPSKTEECK